MKALHNAIFLCESLTNTAAVCVIRYNDMTFFEERSMMSKMLSKLTPDIGLPEGTHSRIYTFLRVCHSNKEVSPEICFHTCFTLGGVGWT